MQAAFQVVGERLCLDFVNTEIVADGNRVDLLGGFDRLVAWCAATQAISSRQAEAIGARWNGTRDAQQVFARAMHFRAALRGMVERIASGQRTVPQGTLDAINEVLRQREGELSVTRTKQGYETRYRVRMSEPGDLLVPVAESAAELLSAGDLSLVRKCQNPDCILYFYDATKSHTRRWCSMSGCGNRAKAAAHYRRAKREAREPRSARTSGR
jgi:predicted RNA-binding Zn ribbon-like protein